MPFKRRSALVPGSTSLTPEAAQLILHQHHSFNSLTSPYVNDQQEGMSQHATSFGPINDRTIKNDNPKNPQPFNRPVSVTEKNLGHPAAPDPESHRAPPSRLRNPFHRSIKDHINQPPPQIEGPLLSSNCLRPVHPANERTRACCSQNACSRPTTEDIARLNEFTSKSWIASLLTSATTSIVDENDRKSHLSDQVVRSSLSLYPRSWSRIPLRKKRRISR